MWIRFVVWFAQCLIQVPNGIDASDFFKIGLLFRCENTVYPRSTFRTFSKNWSKFCFLDFLTTLASFQIIFGMLQAIHPNHLNEYLQSCEKEYYSLCSTLNAAAPHSIPIPLFLKIERAYCNDQLLPHTFQNQPIISEKLSLLSSHIGEITPEEMVQKGKLFSNQLKPWLALFQVCWLTSQRVWDCTWLKVYWDSSKHSGHWKYSTFHLKLRKVLIWWNMWILISGLLIVQKCHVCDKSFHKLSITSFAW